MVEPVSLAAAAVALLASYLQRAAGRIIDRTADAIGDSAVPVVERLYETVKARLKPGTYAGNQLLGVEENPTSPGRQQALQIALAEAMEANAAFAAEIEHLVTAVQAAGGTQVVVTDAGAVAGRDIHQRGQYVAARDMTIGSKETDRD
jgi:AcrR family transcriptional regulator